MHGETVGKKYTSVISYTISQLVLINTVKL